MIGCLVVLGAAAAAVMLLMKGGDAEESGLLGNGLGGGHEDHGLILNSISYPPLIQHVVLLEELCTPRYEQSR